MTTLTGIFQSVTMITIATITKITTTIVMMTQTPLTSISIWIIDVMDFVDNSMAAWEEYENSIEDNSNDNYYTSYELRTKLK